MRHRITLKNNQLNFLPTSLDMRNQVVNARISPNGHLNLLSRQEMSALLQVTRGNLYPVFRSSSLAVLNYGDYLDDGEELLRRFPDYEIRVIKEERGIKLDLFNAPASAFVDGEMIRGINEHIFSVLRDMVFIDSTVQGNASFDLETSNGITNAVFHILRNARVLKPDLPPRMVVCWGGHSIPLEEYDYSKEVGHQLGLRDMDICTGCGAGAMKGPMKGAAVGHAKQRNYTGQYLGITEPGIIASESPNPIVKDLVIMPDIEKRLESFVRLGHAIIVFPGGVGTTEEILYILGILVDPANAHIPLPLIFTGPASAKAYFELWIALLQKPWGPRCGVCTASSSMIRKRLPGRWWQALPRCGISDGLRKTPTSTTGSCTFHWISSSPLKPLTKTCVPLTCARDGRSTCSLVTCAGPFPALSAAMSRRQGYAPLLNMGLLN